MGNHNSRKSLNKQNLPQMTHLTPLLLTGSKGSGKSTFIRTLKMNYKLPYTLEEIQMILESLQKGSFVTLKALLLHLDIKDCPELMTPTPRLTIAEELGGRQKDVSLNYSSSSTASPLQHDSTNSRRSSFYSKTSTPSNNSASITSSRSSSVVDTQLMSHDTFSNDSNQNKVDEKRRKRKSVPSPPNNQTSTNMSEVTLNSLSAYSQSSPTILSSIIAKGLMLKDGDSIPTPKNSTYQALKKLCSAPSVQSFLESYQSSTNTTTTSDSDIRSKPFYELQARSSVIGDLEYFLNNIERFLEDEFQMTEKDQQMVYYPSHPLFESLYLKEPHHRLPPTDYIVREINQSMIPQIQPTNLPEAIIYFINLDSYFVKEDHSSLSQTGISNRGRKIDCWSKTVEMFSEMVNNQHFSKIPIFVLLTRFDSFKKKLQITNQDSVHTIEEYIELLQYVIDGLQQQLKRIGGSRLVAMATFSTRDRDEVLKVWELIVNHLLEKKVSSSMH